MAVWPCTDNVASRVAITARCSSASKVALLFDEVVSSTSHPYDLPREIRMSRRDFKLFLVEIDSEEEPSETLKAAAERYKQKYGNE